MEHRRQIRPKRRRWPSEVYERAQELLNEKPTPTGADIAGRLAEAFVDSPSERAINDWITRGVIVLTDEDAPWRLGDAEAAEDIPLVLDIARALMEASADARWRARHPKWPTQAVGKWIVRLRRAYPDLAERAGALRVYELAYLARHSEGRWIDTTLAFTPWRDGGAALNEARKRFLLPQPDEDDAVARMKTMLEAFG